MDKRLWTAGERRKFSTNMKHFGGNIMTGFVVTRLLTFMLAFVGMGAIAYAVTSGDHHSGYAMAAAGAVVLNDDQMKELKGQVDKGIDSLKSKLEGLASDAETERKKFGSETAETKTKIDKALSEIGDLTNSVKGLEKEILEAKRNGGTKEAEKSIGEIVADSEQFKEQAARGGLRKGERVIIEMPKGFSLKSAIINATGQNQPLVPADRKPGLVVANQEVPTIRALLSSVPTESNMIEFSTEDSFTNSAAPQGAGTSPNVRENTEKAESTMTFGLTYKPIQTIAHYFNVSKQALADAKMLRGHIETRGRYGLAMKVEEQLLEGDGVGSNLDGLLNQATSYNTGLDEVGDTIIDKLRRSMVQLRLKNHRPGFFGLSPIDWALIETLKESGSGASGRYIFGDPHNLAPQNIWRVPVVDTQSIDEGDFLAVDNGPDVVQIYDREQVSVAISFEHGSNFIKNMATILIEERLCLVVYKPFGIVEGSF